MTWAGIQSNRWPIWNHATKTTNENLLKSSASMRVTEILCSFRLVLEGKTGKYIPESSRLEFLGKFFTNNFALLDAKLCSVSNLLFSFSFKILHSQLWCKLMFSWSLTLHMQKIPLKIWYFERGLSTKHWCNRFLSYLKNYFW